jgi:hypothetical protein
MLAHAGNKFNRDEEDYAMKAWESIFYQSPVNNGRYDEDELPQVNWDWPNDTWFQSRLHYMRDHEPRQSKLRKSVRRDDAEAQQTH